MLRLNLKKPTKEEKVTPHNQAILRGISHLILAVAYSLETFERINANMNGIPYAAFHENRYFDESIAMMYFKFFAGIKWTVPLKM